MNEKAKHTPGPWTVFKPASQDVCYEGGECPATIRGAGIHVATMPGERSCFSQTAEANARLISSAPELLEALEFLVRLLEQEGASEFVLGDARAAIAKARGLEGGAK